ncbi:hypothetical protein [Burkholderia vietnamiensis]|uniref:hypothetical protein n=1 Tax=Burkholderia vietnamiensis TaxID=60552 RepID=UPI001CF16A4A|nr:hypothetical protein [Burkholderia vietnamiensis]MCA8197340.1 hypothetical protein [Burkholderia vietnamiensis]
MFGTLDALSRGKFFWEYAVNKWPALFSVSGAGTVAPTAGLCLAGEGGFELVMSPVHRFDNEDHLLFQVRIPGVQTVHLAVSLSADGCFLAGSHCGSSVDETGAVHALALYAPFIRGEGRTVPGAP